MEEKDIIISTSSELLTVEQKKQFYKVLYDGFCNKFVFKFGDNKELITKLLTILFETNLLPSEELFYAIEKTTQKILGVIILYKGGKPKILDYIKFILKVLKIISIKKVIIFAKGFSELDRVARINMEEYEREVFMFAVDENYRGLGIGTILMNAVLK